MRLVPCLIMRVDILLNNILYYPSLSIAGFILQFDNELLLLFLAILDETCAELSARSGHLYKEDVTGEYCELIDEGEEAKERACDSLRMCIITTLNQGLRNGGGIGDILRAPSSEVGMDSRE